MDASTDSGGDDARPRPAKRSKRSRDGENADNERNLNSQEVGIMRGSYDPKQGSRFIGSGSGIHFIRTVYGMLAGNSTLHSAPEATTSPAVPGEDDELSGEPPTTVTGSATETTPDTNLWSPDEVDSDHSGAPRQTFEDLIRWTKTYFENWHPIFPFLHAPTVLDVFDKVSKNGLRSISAAEMTIVRALVSIGIADGRQAITRPPPPPVDMVFVNINQLMTDVQFAISQPATLRNLQALFAAQLFLVSMLKFNFASRIGGTVVRMAFHLGLHRCPSRFRNFSAHENQLRRRMFFCVYCLDRILCQSLGLPLGISDTDIDVCYPDEETHLGPHQIIEHRNGDKQLITLSLFARHAKIRGMILELRNKALRSRHETAKRALRIEMELSRWSNLLHEIVDEVVDEDNEADTAPCSISALHRMYLLLLEHESTIALNRPLITANKSSTNAMSALQNCIKASRSIISTLDEYCKGSDPANRRDTHLKTPVTWPLVTWCCWMSCFILAFAALEGRSKREFAVKHAEKSLHILNHLSLRKTRWPELCADAVRHVKSALTRKTGERNGADSPITERPTSSRDSHPLVSPTSHHLRTSRTEAFGSAKRREQTSRTNTEFPTNDAIIIQQSPWTVSSFPQESYPAESPDSILAQSGRFGTIDFNFSAPDHAGIGFDEGIFDPFSAIDFSNFTMTNYNFVNDFGPC